MSRALEKPKVIRIIEACEPILTPLLIAAAVACGSWGAWVTVSSYDANQHLTDYAETTRDLKQTAADLSKIETQFVELHTRVQATTGVNQILLNEILREIRDD